MCLREGHIIDPHPLVAIVRSEPSTPHKRPSGLELCRPPLERTIIVTTEPIGGTPDVAQWPIQALLCGKGVKVECSRLYDPFTKARRQPTGESISRCR